MVNVAARLESMVQSCPVAAPTARLIPPSDTGVFARAARSHLLIFLPLLTWATVCLFTTRRLRLRSLCTTCDVQNLPVYPCE